MNPYELVPPVLLSTLMGTFSIVDAGVAWRALSAFETDMKLAQWYFSSPLPIVGPIKMIVGPGILLLIPKVIVEDVLPLKRGTYVSKTPHVYGCLHLLPVLLIFLTLPAAIQPTVAAASGELSYTDCQQILHANLALVFICIMLMVFSALQVAAKNELLKTRYAPVPTSV